ncbi:MAG: hypothetical protein JST54_21930 [Deltaproteobacteria bacterium]|nr:hypothetical protein [Deltaproteobacteria bacterium]
MVALLVLALAAAPDPLAAARKHLQANQFDALVLDLGDGVELGAADQATAAQLLVKAAEGARKGDPIIALQLAQMAHRRDEKNAPALQVLAELALADHDDAEAEREVEAWQKLAPDDTAPALMRARIAADEGDWDTVHALAGTLSADASVPPAAQKSARELLKLADAHAPAPVAKPAAAEDRIKHAAEVAARDRDMEFASHQAPAEADVIIYGTSWCHFCKEAKKFFEERGVPYTELDIEEDHDANNEMIRKLRALGRSPQGVPVIDVRGTIIDGFNPKAIEQALKG